MSWSTALIAIFALLCVVGLIAWAGGPDHHRGDEVGTHGTKILVVGPAN